jgi:hypothetical protein
MDNKIPQVNQGVTDRNREQSKKICELAGKRYHSYLKGCWTVGFDRLPIHACDAGADYRNCATNRQGNVPHLPSGSFTLDQVVGMLWEHDCYLEAYTDASNTEQHKWVRDIEGREGDEWIECVDRICPHDLTAAMDALIKVLEEKNDQKEGA